MKQGSGGQIIAQKQGDFGGIILVFLNAPVIVNDFPSIK
jgi:hypothetical protein